MWVRFGTLFMVSSKYNPYRMLEDRNPFNKILNGAKHDQNLSKYNMNDYISAEARQSYAVECLLF